MMKTPVLRRCLVLNLFCRFSILSRFSDSDLSYLCLNLDRNYKNFRVISSCFKSGSYGKFTGPPPDGTQSATTTSTTNYFRIRLNYLHMTDIVPSNSIYRPRLNSEIYLTTVYFPHRLKLLIQLSISSLQYIIMASLIFIIKLTVFIY